jgi:hypothetical protein
MPNVFSTKDDLRFLAILKRGPLVSSTTETFVRVDDVNMKHSFQMKVLQSATLEDSHPAFGTAGLYGIWTLKENYLGFEALGTDYTCLVTENVEPFKTLYAGVLGLLSTNGQNFQ